MAAFQSRSGIPIAAHRSSFRSDITAIITGGITAITRTTITRMRTIRRGTGIAIIGGIARITRGTTMAGATMAGGITANIGGTTIGIIAGIKSGPRVQI